MSNIRQPLPCAAYTGKDPFIFISYSHMDIVRVYPEIKALYNRGYRIWYDDGIGRYGRKVAAPEKAPPSFWNSIKEF